MYVNVAGQKEVDKLVLHFDHVFSKEKQKLK